MTEAFSAGVEPGGLRTLPEIKILLCYMLHTVNAPISRSDVMDIVTWEGMANYFSTEEAIDELIRQEHLCQDDGGMLTVTATGREIGDTLWTRIPYTLRENSVKSALHLLKMREAEKDNKVTVEKLPEGGCAVTCLVMDGERALLQVTLRVADERQAAIIREQFLRDPSLLYRTNLAVLTGDAGLRRGGTQIFIDL